MSQNNFWIDVSLQDEEYEKQALVSIAVLEIVHAWTIEQLNKYFAENLKMYPFREFRPHLNAFVNERKLWKNTQRYSIERASEHAFPYFSDNVRLDEEDRLIPVPPREACEIQIRARNVWRRYLARGRGITTNYGILYPEGEWKKILREQAEQAGNIPIDLFPFLWHSLTLKYFSRDERWKIKFNFHSTGSRFAERAERQLEKEYGEIQS